MSEPMSATDQTREATCTLCAGPVTERMHHGMYDSSRWIKDKHDSPCGLPCLAAGVPIKVYKTGEFHAGSQKCPKCKPGSRGDER